MKKLFVICTVSSFIAIACGGCGKKAVTSQNADPFSTNKLSNAFSSASSSQKGIVEKAEASIGQQNYGRAYDLLQSLYKDTSLSTEQSQALKDSLLVLGNTPRNAP